MPLTAKGISQKQEPWKTGSGLLDLLLESFLPTDPQEALSSISPMAAPVGTISQATWKAMTPQAKAMLTMLADAFPEAFAKVLKHPRELMAFVGPLEPGVLGRLTRQEFPGGLKSAQATVIPSQAKKLQTSAHEIFGHLLNEERLMKTPPGKQEIFGMLEDVLPWSTTGSLKMRTQQLRDLRSPSELVGIRPEHKLKYEYDLQQVIMDEAMASLAEAQTMTNLDEPVSQLVKKLSESLGLTLR